MIIVLNCGSQSLKYKIFSKDFELIKKEERRIKRKKDYKKVLEKELKKLSIFENKVNKICHRVVHGGEKFREPVKITKKNLKELKKYKNIAPLHNPYNILGIEISFKIFPQAKQIAVFDTGFYSHLPKKAFIYPLPENLRKKYGFRKFGFHGISHEYAARRGAQEIKKPFSKLKIITCHLGGGASITAIKQGKAIDTSMGFTPLEGLMMMTRSGDIDPGIVIRLSKDLSSEKLNKILNNFSGVKGISGLTDMKEVLEAIKRGDKKAKLALDIFVYRIQKYIGAYFALLNGCDLLVFTGAIGAGSQKIRKMIGGNLKILKNTKIISFPTNEELLIAQKSQKL